MNKNVLSLCLLIFGFTHTGHATTLLNLDKVKSIECSSPTKVVFSTTGNGAEKYARKNGFIPYSYQISGFYNVTQTGQMKVTRSTRNSITLGDFTDYAQGPDVVHELTLKPTNKTSIYNGYLTGVVEKSGQDYKLTHHPLNCLIQML